MSDWLKHWQSFKTMRARERVLRIIFRMFFLPVLVVVHIVAPCTKLARSWSAPMSKFVSHMAGYFVFIVALFVHNYLDFKTRSSRGPPNTGVQLYILLFVVGKWISSLKNMWSYGYQVCFVIITGPPIPSVEDQYCFACWRLSSSVGVCNTPRPACGQLHLCRPRDDVMPPSV